MEAESRSTGQPMLPERERDVETAADRTLQVLLLDYEMARDDERLLVTVQATLLPVAVGLLAGLAALLSSSCQFTGDKSGCTRVPPPLLAAVPLVPLALFGFLALLGEVATVRTYYLRALESELQTLAPAPLTLLPGLSAGSYMQLVTGLVSLRRGRRGYRLITSLVLACNVVLFGGFAIFIVQVLPVPYAVAAAIVYGSSFLVLAREFLAETVGGRRLFQSLVASHVATPARRRVFQDGRTVPGERSMVGYLLLPRPQDALKWLFLPVVFVLVVATAGGAQPDQLRRAAVLWLVLEFLVYPARYQWNDIRGFFSDQEHAARGDRRRLPGPPSRARDRFLVSGSVAALKVLIALAIVLIFRELRLGWPVAAVIIAVFGTAALYETLRAVEDHATPAPIRTRSTLLLALWIVVGFGYVVRGLAGLGLAIGLGARPGLTITLAITLLAFGTMFVTLTWALEATSFASTRDGQILWPAEAPSGRQHVLALVTWLPHRMGSQKPTDWRPLLGRRPLLAPDSVALIAAGAGAGLTGGLLVGLGGVIDGVLVAVVGAVLAGLVAESARWRVVVVAAGTGILIAALAAIGSSQAWLGALPWLFVAAIDAFFCAQSWHTLKHPYEAPSAALRGAVVVVLRALVGSAAWDRMNAGRTTRG